MQQPTTESPTQQLATLILGQPLADFCRSRRPEKSWRLIARDLYNATNGRIDVSPEMLRVWYRTEDAA